MHLKLNLVALLVGLSLLGVSPLRAGGPVLSVEEGFEQEPKEHRKIGGLALGLAAVAILLVLTNSKGDCNSEEIPVETPPTGGCE